MARQTILAIKADPKDIEALRTLSTKLARGFLGIAEIFSDIIDALTEYTKEVGDGSQNPPTD